MTIWAAAVATAQEGQTATQAGAGAWAAADPGLVETLAAQAPGVRLFAAARSVEEAVALKAADADGTRGVLAPLAAVDLCEGLIARLTFDEAQEPDIWERLVQDGARGATPDAAGEPLFARWGAQALARFAEQAKAAGLELGFAGKLEAADAPRLLALAPDWIIFGAALRGADGALSAQKLAEIDALTRPPAAPRAVSARLDRVFVRDLTLDVAVGVYAHEHGRVQKMRFTVEVDLAPLTRAVAHFSDVFSYDVIVDRLRALAASGHHELVETLAEETALAALAHPRARRVLVRAEKLDVVEGAVGVEIVREKIEGDDA